ncbi:MAG: family 10 glycosylhydrolase [Kiritimatiellaeota bacterium]|nr:family 10 glycosylhydrolase [Kiritimatiellota bacterium]
MIKQAVLGWLVASVFVRGAASETALNVSWGDHIMVGHGLAELDTPEKIRTAMARWKEVLNVRRIFWRVSAVALERDYVYNPEWRGKYRTTVREILDRFDPLETAIEAAHAQGLRIYAYHTIFDEGCPPTVLYGGTTPFPWQSKFTRAHPEYLVVDRSGVRRQWGVMEYAYPEVRAYKIGQFRWFMEHYDFDGMYVCTRSHSPPADFADEFGYNRPVVAEFRKRFGIDIRTEPFDKEKWRRLRGTYLTRFFRELRTALPGKTILAAIPRGQYLGPPYGNLYLDWQAWVRAGVVDGLVVGVISGKWLYPNQPRTDREKGYLCSQEEGLGMRPVREDIEQVYGPMCREYGRLLFLNAGGCADSAPARRWSGLTGLTCSSLSSRLYTNQAFVPDHPALGLSRARFTIEFRIFLRRYTAWPRVLSKYNHNLPDDEGRGWEVMLDDKGRVQMRLNDGASEHTLLSAGRVSLGRWTHVACVSEGKGGRMRLVIDGRTDPETAPAPARVRDTPCRLYFGEYGDGAGTRRLDGLLDEVRILNRPVDFPVVPANPYTGSEPGTIALWHFDRGTDTGFPSSGPVSGLGGRLKRLGERPAYVESAPGFGRALSLDLP